MGPRSICADDVVGRNIRGDCVQEVFKVGEQCRVGRRARRNNFRDSMRFLGIIDLEPDQGWREDAGEFLDCDCDWGGRQYRGREGWETVPYYGREEPWVILLVG